MRWRQRVPARVVLLLAIGLGGAIGALGRHAAETVLPPHPEAFPWATLLVNVAGAAILGTIAAAPSGALPHHGVLRPALGTGACGGLTTLSTLALEVFERLPDRPLLAASYSAISVALAPLSAFLGVWAVSRHLERHRSQQGGSKA